MNKIIYLLPALLLVSSARADTNLLVQRNLYWAKHICQCRNCLLQGVDLNTFKPGSQITSENTIYQQTPIKLNNAQYNFIESGAWMSCDFNGADFSNANLANSNFRVTFRGYITPLYKANFAYANLTNANLQQAVLYATDFSYAKLVHSNLHRANLSQANFNQADFSAADLSDSIAKADAMHGWGSNMRQANFSHANLEHAEIYASFFAADFSHAKLQNAILEDSQDAVPKDTSTGNTETNSAKTNSINGNWEKVNFSYADLTNAQFKSNGKQIEITKSKAIFCHTILPNGKINNKNCLRTEHSSTRAKMH